jgi:hypothetical protein
MSARDKVSSLLEEWRQQTLAETEALRARNWPAVRECHRAKDQLQALLQRIPEAREYAAEESGRQTVDELIALDLRNRDWLATQMAASKARQSQIEDNARNLQRLRKSYAGPSRSCWQSYS